MREVREGRGALVFPEGTRTKDGNLGKLKSGAFVIAAEAGVDMIPCRIIYKGGKMRVFGRCTVVFGKPIPAEKLKLGPPARMQGVAGGRAGKAAGGKPAILIKV